MARRRTTIGIALAAAIATAGGVTFTTYDRGAWPHWIDADHDCQDTRQEILVRRSTIDVTLDESGCKVLEGCWISEFTGEELCGHPGPRSEEHPDRLGLHIDHVIPLKWADDHGGFAWDREDRTTFANDYQNLIPVEGRLNIQKSASGFDEWAPEDFELACAYYERWDEMLSSYELVMPRREWVRLYRNLGGCRGW